MGGSYGMLNVPLPSIFGFEFTTERDLYFLILAVTAIVYFGLDRLAHSRFGRALRAISQDEDAARACGISIIRYKSKCFLVAAFTAGIAGSLYAHHARYLNPNDFTFNKSIEILIHGGGRRPWQPAWCRRRRDHHRARRRNSAPSGEWRGFFSAH